MAGTVTALPGFRPEAAQHDEPLGPGDLTQTGRDVFVTEDFETAEGVIGAVNRNQAFAGTYEFLDRALCRHAPPWAVVVGYKDIIGRDGSLRKRGRFLAYTSIEPASPVEY